MKTHNIALVPAYKPNHLMLEMLPQLKDAGFEIIVVDDGGGPQYSHLFEEAEKYATILTHPQNRGKGAAMKTGYSYISEHFDGDCVVVTVDADGQHRVSDALKVCEIAHSSPKTLVLGSRKLKGKIPLRSRVGNTITRLVYQLSTGVRVYDTQTGLRACGIELIPELLSIEGDRYEFEMNVLLTFAKKHIPIEEREIETIYINDNETSHFNAVKDSFRIYKEILKFSAASFIGFLVDYALYSILVLTTANLRLSNVVARVISATVNFILNRRFVFKNKGNIIKSVLCYFALAVVILVGNTFVLDLLVNELGIGRLIAKILTELCFFVLNFLVQRFIVFRKKSGSRG